MKTLISATTIDDIGNNAQHVYFYASTISKVESKLTADGFEKLTDRFDTDGYQTWYKNIKGFFNMESETWVSVLKRSNFIG